MPGARIIQYPRRRPTANWLHGLLETVSGAPSTAWLKGALPDSKWASPLASSPAPPPGCGGVFCACGDAGLRSDRPRRGARAVVARVAAYFTKGARA